MATNISIYLPERLAKKIDNAAAADDRPRSAYIRRILEREVGEVTGETRLKDLEQIANSQLKDQKL